MMTVGSGLYPVNPNRLPTPTELPDDWPWSWREWGSRARQRRYGRGNETFYSYPKFTIAKRVEIDWSYYPGCARCWRRIYPDRQSVPYQIEGFLMSGFKSRSPMLMCAGCGFNTSSGLKIPVLHEDVRPPYGPRAWADGNWWR